jgi:hypothetical protein
MMISIIVSSIHFAWPWSHLTSLSNASRRVSSTTSAGRDVLIIPETPIYEYSSNYYDALKEPFDRVWQTCGQLGSINYKEGKWLGGPRPL